MNEDILLSDMIQAAHRFHKLKMDGMWRHISQNEFMMLEVIGHYKDEYPDKTGIYVTELAGRLHVSKPAASKMLKTLEEKGYVERQVDTRDRRNTYVALTEEGFKEQKKMEQHMQGFLEKVVRRMGEENFREFTSQMNRMVDSIQEEMLVHDKMHVQEQHGGDND